MTKRVRAHPPISPAEITVIQVMLERASVAPGLYADLHTLRVVDRRGCGCDSVDFTGYDTESPRTIIADGTGETPSGNPVGVIIWGSADSVTGIEVYGTGDMEDDLRLPTLESIRPW